MRLTSTDAYSVGRDLIAYLHTLFQNKNIPFGDFVRDYAQENKFKTVTTQSFQADMEKSFNGSLQPLFDNYVYGRSQKRGLGAVSYTHLTLPTNREV